VTRSGHEMPEFVPERHSVSGAPDFCFVRAYSNTLVGMAQVEPEPRNRPAPEGGTLPAARSRFGPVGERSPESEICGAGPPPPGATLRLPWLHEDAVIQVDARDGRGDDGASCAAGDMHVFGPTRGPAPPSRRRGYLATAQAPNREGPAIAGCRGRASRRRSQPVPQGFNAPFTSQVLLVGRRGPRARADVSLRPPVDRA
jgi:hypothetical protein